MLLERTRNYEKMAINDVLPVKASRRHAINANSKSLWSSGTPAT